MCVCVREIVGLVVGFFFVVMVVRVCMSERGFLPFGQSLSLSFFLPCSVSFSDPLSLSLCVWLLLSAIYYLSMGLSIMVLLWVSAQRWRRISIVPILVWYGMGGATGGYPYLFRYLQYLFGEGYLSKIYVRRGKKDPRWIS